jgi:hypothetical protein
MIAEIFARASKPLLGLARVGPGTALAELVYGR